MPIKNIKASKTAILYKLENTKGHWHYKTLRQKQVSTFTTWCRKTLSELNNKH